MFAILVLFGASYTFKRNEHVRVEIFYLFLSERGQLWLDLIGTLFSCFRRACCSSICPGRSSIRPTPSAKCRAMPAA